MKFYVADREKHGRSVKVREGNDFYWLDPRRSQKIINHSPDGFEWGYGGSGPAQLSLAILLDHTDPETAQRLYQKFKFDFIANQEEAGFQISSGEIADWIAHQEESRTAER